MDEGNKNCLLCGAQSKKITPLLWDCPRCGLLFKSPDTFPDFDREKARYETHNNNLKDKGYLKYLNKLFSKIENVEGDVLDFGCGPSKGLEALVDQLKIKNIKVDSYDPIFFPLLNLEKQKKRYDLVYASECVEHFYNPLKSFNILTKIIKPGGRLAVATNFSDVFKNEKVKNLDTWWYAKDPTHAVFYSQKTFKYISNTYQFEILYSKSPHIILKSKKV